MSKEPKNLVIIMGPPAVGKMTVGHALAKRTGYKLFHNHISIEVALQFFDFGTDGFQRISGTIRNTVFETVAQSDLPGLIFTYVWAFNKESELPYVQGLIDKWREQAGGGIYFLELTATEAARRIRNRHPDRLDAKPSKRDLAQSEALRLAHERKYQFNSEGEFPLMLPHMVIDNTSLSADEVARQFLATFDLLGAPKAD